MARRPSSAVAVITLSFVFVLIAPLAACSSAPPPEEAKASTHAALTGGDDDDDDTTAPPAASSKGDDDDDSTSQPPQHGIFDNWCTAVVDLDDNMNPYCEITVWCGGWSTQSVVTTRVDDADPCRCECQ